MGKQADNQPLPAPPGLADVLFTPVQQRVLGLLFGQPQRRFQSGELIRLAGSGTGSVHRLMTRAEWRRKRNEPDSFAARIAAQPRLFVTGSDDDLG